MSECISCGYSMPSDAQFCTKCGMAPELRLMGQEVVERFNREARTAAKLSHPSIIPIYAVRQTQDLTYFVMKLIQGRSLESVIREEERLPTDIVQTILSQVGSALDYADRNGVIHRDVKPGNVMLDEEGWAVVTDFGIAKAVEAKGLTMTGAAIGTPSYMSPEQCSGLDITGAADQYSLGVVAYEMLSGKLPFEGESAMTVMYCHIASRFSPMHGSPLEVKRIFSDRATLRCVDWGSFPPNSVGSPLIQTSATCTAKAMSRMTRFSPP